MIIKKNKNNLTKNNILIISLLVFIFLFTITSLYWWNRENNILLKIIKTNFSEKINDASIFDNDFTPKEIEHKYFSKVNNKRITNIEDTTVIEEFFDTTYYFLLWEKFISEYGMTEVDSLTIDSLIRFEMKKNKNETNDNEPTIIEEKDETEKSLIKKEELLFVKTIKAIINFNDTLSNNDSIYFSKISDINYTIEFWNSPLNFKGIKKTGNIIIVYGVNDFNNIKINYSSKNKLHIIINKTKYYLKNDGQFHSFKELLII